MLLTKECLQTASSLWLFLSEDCALSEKDDTYSCMLSNGLKLCCRFQKQGETIRRIDSIENTTEQPVYCEKVCAKFLLDGGKYEVLTQYCGSQDESNGSWAPLSTAIEAVCNSTRICKNAAPMMALWDTYAQAGIVFHLIADSTWCIRACKEQYAGRKHRVAVTCGFAGGVMLAPHETVFLPEVLFYDFRSRLDLDAWKLHRWFSDFVGTKPMPVLYNTWLYQYDHFSPDGILQQISKAAQLGVEYFVVDAGWFGEKGKWTKTLGDWAESPDSAMEGKLSSVADSVKQHHMQFGLWIEPERASKNSRIVAQHPEYFIIRGEECQLDFAKESAREYIQTVFDTLIEKYGIRYFKLDSNRDLIAREENRQHLDYFAGYRLFLRTLREKYPEVHFEACASGGLRMSLNSAMLFDSLWISDNQSHYIGMDIYKNSLKRLPPQAMERWAVFYQLPKASPAPAQPYTWDPMIGSDDGIWKHVVGTTQSWLDGFLLGSTFGFSCDLNQMLPDTFEHFRTMISDFKKDRSFWQHAECRVLSDSDDLLVLQYNDRSFSRIEIFCYCCLTSQEAITVYPVYPDLRNKAIRIPISGSYTCSRIVLEEASATEKGCCN